MSGAGLTIEAEGLGELQARLDRLCLGSSQMRRLLGRIGAVTESRTRRRLSEDKSDPSGEPWPELDPAYAARKSAKSAGGLLEFEGDLIDSITHELSAFQVEVGTNLIYGATHQFGDEDRGIAQRAYLGIGDDDRQELEDLTTEFIRELFQ